MQKKNAWKYLQGIRVSLQMARLTDKFDKAVGLLLRTEEPYILNRPYVG